MTNDKLTAAITALTKRYGEGTVMRLGERPRVDLSVISTGSRMLDTAIGVGGIPRGRTTEIWGEESSGKTTLMQHLVAEAQKDGTALYVDMEHAVDVDYAARCGVDLDALLFSQPNTGEQALQIVEDIARSGAVSLIVVDSVAKLVPRLEVENDMGHAHMASIARLMAQATRKLTPVISANNIALVFVNQTRSNVGVMYGSPETTTGGAALRFEASVRIKLKRVNKDTDEEHARIRAKVIKNKIGPPLRSCELSILYASGLDKIDDVVQYAKLTGKLKSSGAWLNYGERKWHGEAALIADVREDGALLRELAV